MVAPLFWEQEEQFDSDILHHPLWFVDIVWKSGNSEDAYWKQINVLTTRKDCWLLYLSSKGKNDRQALVTVVCLAFVSTNRNQTPAKKQKNTWQMQ